MEENMKKELAEVLLKSDFRELAQVDFRENMAVCRQLCGPRIEFEQAVNVLANSWIPIAKRYGLRLVEFGPGNYGRLLEDGSLGVRFNCGNSGVVKIAADQNANRTCQRFWK